MQHTIRLSDLQAMSSEERAQTLERMGAEARAPINGQAAMIAGRIRGFELRYEMSSAQLIERLKSDEQRETADIAEWLYWISLRDRTATRG